MVFAPLLRSLIACVFGWVIVAPLAALTPKRRDWIAVIGRQDGRFLDNAKYFFLQASAIAPDLRVVFVTEQKEAQTLLACSRRETLRFPDVRAIWFLMRCGSVVVDEAAWFKRMRFFLLIRAKVVQLWHGIPFKRIELDHWRHETGSYAWVSHPVALRLRLLAYRMTGRLTCYAAVIVTSDYYRDHAFAPAFIANQFSVIGYPRNDFARSLEGEDRKLAWINVDASIKSRLEEWENLARKLVLIAPTFRESGTMPMQLNVATLRAIDEFADANNVEFLFKFHPLEQNVDHISGKHFHVCSRDSDIYPVLPLVAALVTDYSSISMDFLLVDQPLMFLIPEGDDYTRNDRQLQFDPRAMMPGPVAQDWPSLLSTLLTEWSDDTHKQERAKYRSKAFDDLPQAEAVPKLIALMRNEGWVRSATAMQHGGTHQSDSDSR